MSQRRGRVANKTSMVASPPSKTKGKAGARSVQKKTPVKRSPPGRANRLSGLTAATLLQYCANILSPTSKKRSQHSMEDDAPLQTSRHVSNKSDSVEAPPATTRLRREASSRASAMIMQQNEIERSRFNYPLPPRRARVKSPLLKEPLRMNVPPIATPVDNLQPSTKSLAKYPPLTEALLAEHNRLLGITPSYHTTKRDNLLKWTQDVPLAEQEPPLETPPVEEKNQRTVVPMAASSSSVMLDPNHGHFLPPSSYPLDFRSFYPLLPCWQYPPAWPFAPTSLSLHSSIADRLVESKSIGPLAVKNGCGDDDEKKTTRRRSSPKKRPVRSLTTGSRRTNSSPTVHRRAQSSAERKRTHSAGSVPFPVKKAKVVNSWSLFGKFDRQLVSIESDQPPVYRKCYSSIRHLTERDIIKSNDCVILRPDTGRHTDATPYLAKVKYFWEEAISGEIRMSLMWFYHPEHTELSARAKEHFLANELLASNYADCINVACIEDKCYVLTLNEYNRYCLREKRVELFEHSQPISELKFFLNKNTTGVQHHRALPAKHVDLQNVFFCRYVYDYRAKRIVKNPF